MAIANSTQECGAYLIRTWALWPQEWENNFIFTHKQVELAELALGRPNWGAEVAKAPRAPPTQEAPHQRAAARSRDRGVQDPCADRRCPTEPHEVYSNREARNWIFGLPRTELARAVLNSPGSY